MKKRIVLSVNDNPDYLYFAPITCWAWRQFGWEPILMYHGEPDRLSLIGNLDEIEIIEVPKIEGYRSDTITQVSRLYASLFIENDDYVMTGDIDLLPLSNYWNPNFEDKTVWGHDLTSYGHYPICFIGMKSQQWRDTMGLLFSYPYPILVGYGIMVSLLEEFMKRDLDSLPQAKDPDFYKYWFTDQDLITERLKPYNPVQVHRGQYPNGLAVGRVDRANWSLALDRFIDAHLFHQVYHKGREQYFDKMMELLRTFWPDEDFQWVIDYTNEFRKLTGHL